MKLLLLQRDYPVKKMFLYGSYARGNQHHSNPVIKEILRTGIEISV